MQIDERRIAVFIDFENVAMGVRESRYGNFDIDLVLKRLVEKGKIMVKRAYSDWHRYTEFKRAFHQAAIELIDVPQSRYSGKNSADIRMVVDALDLSYQRDHIDTFVLVSGDSDFSPLVSKLRENGRYVIGMGVRQSSSDLLINNCDEFIFYEDLVRPSTENTTLAPKLNRLPRKKAEALRLVVETFQALQREGKEVIYGSAIKQTLVRKLPSFNETYFGYPSFSRLLEDAAENKLLQLTKDQKSGGYIVTVSGDGAGEEPSAAEPGDPTLSTSESSPPPAKESGAPPGTRSTRGGKQETPERAERDPQRLVEFPQAHLQNGSLPPAAPSTTEDPATNLSPPESGATEASSDELPPPEKPSPRPRRRSSRGRTTRKKENAAAKGLNEATTPEAPPAEPPQTSDSPSPTAAPAEVVTTPAQQPTPPATPESDTAGATAEAGSESGGTKQTSAKGASARKKTSRSPTVRSRKSPARKPRQVSSSQTKDSP